MLDLKRIYWASLLLRLAMAALTVWIFAAAILSLVAPYGNAAVGGRPNTVTAVFTGMFDGVLAAVALPRARGPVGADILRRYLGVCRCSLACGATLRIGAVLDRTLSGHRKQVLVFLLGLVQV